MRRFAFLFLAAGMAYSSSAAENPVGLRSLFPNQAPILTQARGLVRLDLPPEVLAECRPDFSDLRILEAQGREVSYQVARGAELEGAARVTRQALADVVDVQQRTVPRGEGPALLVERYRLAVPAPMGGAESWDLVLATPRRSFVRRISAELRPEDGAEPRAIAEGSTFRLENPVREKIRMRLGPLPAGTLEVKIEGEEGFFLEPAFAFETSRELPGWSRYAVPLRVLSREKVAGTTVVVLERPRGLVPQSLRITTQTPAFQRAIEVWDEGQGSRGNRLGRGEVFRLPALTEVDDLEVRIEPGSGTVLRVVLFDADSPPLETLAFSALVPRTALVLALAAPSGPKPAATLFFGGGRARLPHYDLQSLTRGSPLEALRDPGRIPVARLGEATRNPAFDPSPALAFAMRPGAVVDIRRYTHRRSLEFPSSAEGLVRLTVAIEDLAQCRPDLADLRVVDGERRQWAYLLESIGESQVRPLRIGLGETRDGVTRYDLGLPVEPVAVERVELEVERAFFDRSYQLLGYEGSQRRTVAAGRLARRAGDVGPVRIVFPAARVRRLELSVVDGGDAPLRFRSARGRFPVPHIFVAAPVGSYSLLIGNPDDEQPSYELARVRDVILGVQSAEARASVLAPNPDYTARARLVTASGIQNLVVWILLGVAVLVLSVLTLRLVRQGG